MENNNDFSSHKKIKQDLNKEQIKEKERLEKQRKKLEELIEKKIEEAEKKEEKQRQNNIKISKNINKSLPDEDTSIIPTIPLQDYVNDKKSSEKKKTSLFSIIKEKITQNRKKKEQRKKEIEEKRRQEEEKRKEEKALLEKKKREKKDEKLRRKAEIKEQKEIEKQKQKEENASISTNEENKKEEKMLLKKQKEAEKEQRKKEIEEKRRQEEEKRKEEKALLEKKKREEKEQRQRLKEQKEIEKQKRKEENASISTNEENKKEEKMLLKKQKEAEKEQRKKEIEERRRQEEEKRKEEKALLEEKKREIAEKKRQEKDEKLRRKAEIKEQKEREKIEKKERKERLRKEKELLDSPSFHKSINTVDEKKLKKEEEKRLLKEKKEAIRLQKEEVRKEKYKKQLEEKLKKKKEKNEKRLIEINERIEKEKRSKKAKETARKERREKAQLIKKAQEESKEKARKEKKDFKEQINNWYNNLSIVRDRKNRKELQRQALLIDLDGEDSVRSEEKVMYKYVAKNGETGKVETGMFAAFSKLDVHSFLLAEGYEVYEITPQKNLSRPITLFSPKFKVSELDFFLTQLSTFLRAGITLVEAVKILSKQTKKASQRNVYKSVIYELTMGENFSEALSKQGTIFPRLLINMIKTSELTGDLPETLDDMANYYREMEKTRKQMISALTYPIFVLCFALVILIFIMVSVIPQFVSIYASMEAGLPAITVIVIRLSDFLKSYWIYVVLGIVLFIIIFMILFKSIKVFRTIVQSICMNIPIMGKIIIYNEVTMFTKTFASLLNHNVYITDCMEVLSKITGNEVYKMLIFDTISNLAKGEPISNSFKNHWAFPNIAYEMILTGEKTGQLGPMMDKVSTYYQELHKNAVNQIKAFIEPVMIIVLASIVGVILMSVVLPMFDMYQNIGM